MIWRKSLKSSSVDELEFEDGIEDENEKVEFDINIIIKQLEMQPTVEVHERLILFPCFLLYFYHIFFCPLVES
jgi:hypothetical protein